MSLYYYLHTCIAETSIYSFNKYLFKQRSIRNSRNHKKRHCVNICCAVVIATWYQSTNTTTMLGGASVLFVPTFLKKLQRIGMTYFPWPEYYDCQIQRSFYAIPRCMKSVSLFSLSFLFLRLFCVYRWLSLYCHTWNSFNFGWGLCTIMSDISLFNARTTRFQSQCELEISSSWKRNSYL